ncbi:NAD(P)H-binding protein [Nocardioides dubius]|uniref:NAD(P)H-binding protein n=1 Tax=Nocardioides dubius TaxID=317019 RepID=UPI0031CF49A6
MTSLLILGATGAVGARAVEAALADPRVSRVVATTRRPLAPREGLDNRVLDFTALDPDDEAWRVDAVACAIGTTRSIAGSAAGFREIDHDVPVQIAGYTRAAGATSYALVTSVGADPHSRNFYLRVKGETERDLNAIGFDSLTLIRPSGLVGGVRTRPANLGDHLAEASRAVRGLIPRRYRPVHVDRVARALVDSAVTAAPGVTVRESESL